jgi:hypothetical protein
MKSTLTISDKDKVWKVKGSWIHYFWKDGYWWAAPTDPRYNPMLTNVVRAYGQMLGSMTFQREIEEVP